MVVGCACVGGHHDVGEVEEVAHPFSPRLGLFQYGDLHLEHTTGKSSPACSGCLRGIHS